MVTDRELMQQALEALEQVLDWAKTRNRVFIHDRLITLLRERLAQPVQCVGCEGSPAPQNNPCAVCGKAQPVQEPKLSWGVDFADGLLTVVVGRICADGSMEVIHCEQIEIPVREPAAYNKTELNCFAQDLYDQRMREGKHGHYESMFHVIHQCIKKVAPQPRQWQGLTEDEVFNAFQETWSQLEFARAIEAKLREKNT